MTWHPVWEQIFQERGWGRYPGEDLVRFALSRFGRVEERSRVQFLEIGCGPGANLWFLAREGFTVAGIDGSETAIRKARARLDKECAGWKGELTVGDACRLPYAANTFDAVLDIEVSSTNNRESIGRMFREAHRVLKPGGLLFSRTFASGCWGEGTGEQVGPGEWLVTEGPMKDEGLVRFARREELESLIQPFALASVERISRTMENLQKEIVEWILVGQKTTPTGAET